MEGAGDVWKKLLSAKIIVSFIVGAFFLLIFVVFFIIAFTQFRKDSNGSLEIV